VQALTRCKRVQPVRDIEPERKTEPAAVTETLDDNLRRIAVEKPEVLTQHFRERPIGDAVPVREAAAGALQRLRLLRGKPGPQLTDEPRLADAGIAHDRHQVRLTRIHDLLVDGTELLELALAPDEG